jgi:hypothetical protein
MSRSWVDPLGAGHLNEHGRPFNPKSILSMIKGGRP